MIDGQPCATLKACEPLAASGQPCAVRSRATRAQPCAVRLDGRAASPPRRRARPVARPYRRPVRRSLRPRRALLCRLRRVLCAVRLDGRAVSIGHAVGLSVVRSWATRNRVQPSRRVNLSPRRCRMIDRQPRAPVPPVARPVRRATFKACEPLGLSVRRMIDGQPCAVRSRATRAQPCAVSRHAVGLSASITTGATVRRPSRWSRRSRLAAVRGLWRVRAVGASVGRSVLAARSRAACCASCAPRAPVPSAARPVRRPSASISTGNAQPRAVPLPMVAAVSIGHAVGLSPSITTTNTQPRNRAPSFAPGQRATVRNLQGA